MKRLILLLQLFSLSAFSQVCLKDTGPLTKPSRLRIIANKIYNQKCEEILLRGVSIIDPFIIENHRAGITKKIFSNIKNNFKANVIRVPLHPELIKTYGESYFKKYIDKTVKLASDEGLYIILDYHAIGNPITGKHKTPTWGKHKPWKGNPYIPNLKLALAGLEKIAAKYGNRPSIIIGSFNEPAFISWRQWHLVVTQLIDKIRKFAPKVLITVSGTNWGYDLEEIITNPIKRKNLLYESHPYAWKNKKWKSVHNVLSKKYPIIYGEWGYDPTLKINGISGTSEDYGRPLIKFSNTNGIHWTAWIYDDEWTPRIFESLERNIKTEFGKLVFKELQN